MCFGIDNDGIQREQVVGGEKEVEVFERFGLQQCRRSCQYFVRESQRKAEQAGKCRKRKCFTSQKLSMLSFITGGISFASARLV